MGDVEGLERTLAGLIGRRKVSSKLADRESASQDGSYLSPIIQAQLPLGLADLVAYPGTADEIALVVSAAVRHNVAITPRGKGTGNYGQAIPMRGGLVLDMSAARSVIEIGEGFIIADAGAPMRTLELAANEVGQQILLYPSTIQSSIGGFLSGGSGGTGSIKHGMLHTGFVLGLDVVHATGEAVLITLDGAEVDPYIHNYGTAGIIARAKVALEPRQEWRGFFASFQEYYQALSVISSFAKLTPTPRLVSADPAVLAAVLPEDEGIPAGRASLRAILDLESISAATDLVRSAGGRVEVVAEGSRVMMRISTMSYNHPVEWLQRSFPGRYFHVEVSGDALVDRIDEVQAVYQGGMLHIEAQRERPIGMLVGEYVSPEVVYAGFDRLRELGVGYHNPHQWFVDYEPERTRRTALVTDPNGLLNPGKLVTPDLATGDQR